MNKMLLLGGLMSVVLLNSVFASDDEGGEDHDHDFRAAALTSGESSSDEIVMMDDENNLPSLEPDLKRLAISSPLDGEKFDGSAIFNILMDSDYLDPYLINFDDLNPFKETDYINDIIS